jgi:hypothetical protein
MQIILEKNDIENVEKIKRVASIISGLKDGGFMYVKGLQTSYGEIQNNTYVKGISYKNMLKKSISMLDKFEKMLDPNINISVVRGAWLSKEGKESPTCRQSKEFCHYQSVQYDFPMNNPLVKEAISEIKTKLNDRIHKKAEEHDDNYAKFIDGISINQKGELYISGLRLVKKTVVSDVEKVSKHSASSLYVAIKNEILEMLPISKYRTIKIQGKYDEIKLDGVIIKQVLT